MWYGSRSHRITVGELRLLGTRAQLVGVGDRCDTHSLFEMFTEAAREAIGRAQDEAREMGHETVQVEHLLLGLFSDQAGISGRVFADFGLTVEPVRGHVRERLGVAVGSLPEARVRFSPEAKEALRSANRIALGAPATEHMLVVIVRRGEGGACEILRALGADPHRIRFETKKRAWPSSFPDPGGRAAGELRLVGCVPLESLTELDFGD
jgi:ATP-dependent Clp protease ATP-binding subunit ClpC